MLYFVLESKRRNQLIYLLVTQSSFLFLSYFLTLFMFANIYFNIVNILIKWLVYRMLCKKQRNLFLTWWTEE